VVAGVRFAQEVEQSAGIPPAARASTISAKRLPTVSEESWATCMAALG